MLLIRSVLIAVISFSGCFCWSLRDLIVPHYGSITKPKCQGYMQECKFDRHCCAGLECRLGMQDYNIQYLCHSRLVDKDYVEITEGPSWKDYQEPPSDLSEYEEPRSVNVEDLDRRNKELQRKLAELRLLRKTVKQQQLKDVKRRLEEAEIEVLREEKKKYEENINQELAKLREKELQEKLIDMEKKEVNRTLSKLDPNADADMDILDDFPVDIHLPIN